MVDIPLDRIIERIKTSTSLSEEEIKAKIKQKLDELSGLISEQGAAHIVANELKVKLVESGVVTIDKVLSGMRNVEIVGKAKQVYEIREFSSEARSGKVGNFLLVDPTGSMRIVLWNDKADLLKELQVGDVVKIKGGNARTNNGRVEIHAGEGTNLYRNPEGVTVDVDVSAPVVRPEAESKKIAELGEQDQNVSVIATIVQVFDPRFFPSKQNPEQFNYVMNLYLDDGSDNIRCVLWSEQVGSLLGLSRDEVLKYREEPASFETHKTDLLGVIVKIRGRVQKNEMFNRLELVAYEVEKDVEPPESSAESPQEPVASEPVETQAPANPEPAEAKITEPTAPAEKTPAVVGDDELFTLDDIEDLETLDD